MASLENSVVLITSDQADVVEFGSGFPIYRDQANMYVMTCAHVIQDVGGAGHIKINGISASLVALGEKLSCDLAILKITNEPALKVISLSGIAREGQQVLISGYSQNTTQVKILRQTQATLKERVILRNGGLSAEAWSLQIDDNSSSLQRGYSGSPVVDINTGCAIGVITQMQGEGKQGISISVGEIEKVWDDAPSDLLQSILAQIGQEAKIIEQEIQDFDAAIEDIVDRLPDSSQNLESLEWLSNRKLLAERAVSAVLEEFSEKNIEPNLCTKDINESLTLEIELYLELIYFSLVTQRLNLLHEPNVLQSISVKKIYTTALQFVKNRIPPTFQEDQKQLLESRFTYLIDRLSL